MSCLICGPKLATCGIVISVWGVIMLALLGVFFRTHSAVLIEDVPLTEEDLKDTNPPQKVYGIYNQVAYNCFIAAAIYVVVGGFSFCQVALNRRKVTWPTMLALMAVLVMPLSICMEYLVQ